MMMITTCAGAPAETPSDLAAAPLSLETDTANIEAIYDKLTTFSIDVDATSIAVCGR